MRQGSALRLRISASAAVLSFAVFASGCGSSSASAPSASSNPRYGGTIVYGHEQEVPCLIGGWVQEAYIDRQILDSLVEEVPGGKVVPWLATSWSVSADHKTWTFKLKSGVKFTDGTPLDAAAVVTNFQTWLNPATANSTVSAYIGEYYASSKAIDATTFQLTLKKPYAPLLPVLAQGYFGILSPKGLARGVAANCADPIGSGPFIVQRWDRGSDLIFVKNPHYNSAPADAKHQGPAYVDKIIWKFLSDPTVRYGALTTGQADVIYNIPTVDWQAAKSAYQVQQYITPGRPVTLSLNTTKAPFNDVRVRQAFAHSLDRASAVKSAFFGEIPYNGNGALSQSTPGYDAALANAYTHDPAKASALLTAAGWSGRDAAGYRTKNGQELTATIVYPAGTVFSSEGATLLQDLQQQARQVGFNVKLVAATQAETFSGKYSTPASYDALTWYWTSPTAGVLYIVWRQNLPNRPNYNNSSFYNNPQLEQLINEANSTLDPVQANQFYAQAQQIISGQAVAIGLYTQTTSLAISSKLHGVWLEASQGEPVFSDAYFTP